MLRDLETSFVDRWRALWVSDSIIETKSMLVYLTLNASSTSADVSVYANVNGLILSFASCICNRLDLLVVIDCLYSLSRRE